jgi:hypothetical protein
LCSELPRTVAGPCSIEVTVVTASSLLGMEVSDVGACAKLVDWLVGTVSVDAVCWVDVGEVFPRAVASVFALGAGVGRGWAVGLVG